MTLIVRTQERHPSTHDSCAQYFPRSIYAIISQRFSASPISDADPASKKSRWNNNRNGCQVILQRRTPSKTKLNQNRIEIVFAIISNFDFVLIIINQRKKVSLILWATPNSDDIIVHSTSDSVTLSFQTKNMNYRLDERNATWIATICRQIIHKSLIKRDTTNIFILFSASRSIRLRCRAPKINSRRAFGTWCHKQRRWWPSSQLMTV